MEFEEVVMKRRSIRNFKEEDLPRNNINHMLQLAHEAPSAGNLQARDFVVVRDEEIKDKLVDAALGQTFISQAPWVVVFCANKRRSGKKYGKRGEELYSVQDATAAVQNFLLAAVDKGYGTVWVGAFKEHEVSEALSLPDWIRPIAIVPVGIPAHVPDEPDKIDHRKLTHREKW